MQERLIARLCAPGARLLPHGARYAVFPRNDRRRRPLAIVAAREVSQLTAEGAVARDGDADAYVITPAGRARSRRSTALPAESFRAQHDAVGARTVMTATGVEQAVRGVGAGAGLMRLQRLRDVNGAPYLSDAEWRAACVVRALWDRGQIGIFPQVDWARETRAQPGSNAAPFETALDARQRLEALFGRLSPTLSGLVRDIVCGDVGLEEAERQRGWPARSAKLLLKTALEVLA